MTKFSSKELQKYREYIKKRLAELTPLLQKAAAGDFTEKIKIPEKEDEFTELLVGLSLMMDDLRELKKSRKEVEEMRKKRIIKLEQWERITTGRELKMIELKKEMQELKEEIETLKRGK